WYPAPLHLHPFPTRRSSDLFHCSAANFTSRGLTNVTLLRRTREHRIFGCNPTFSLTTHERRNTVFDACITNYFCIPYLYKDGTFRVLYKTWDNCYWT